MVPHRIVDPKTHEPAEQQIELQTVHQLALGTHPIERLQQHRSQKLLRRNRRPPKVRIEGCKLARQVAKRGVRNLADRAQWMVTPHARLQIHVAEQRSRPLVASRHLIPLTQSASRESRPERQRQRLLQQPPREERMTPELKLLVWCTAL